MKRPLLLLALLFVATGVCAQDPDYSRKFGKVTDYELEMTSYARDTSAVVVFLYEDTQVYYTMTTSNIANSPFQQTRNYFVKIKVLKPEGVSLADVEIPFHLSTTTKEFVGGISAAAYNKVGGKTVKTEIKSKDIFQEQVSENTQVRKFSIPEVRVGTVIEYKYSITSDFFWIVEPLLIQHAYPVVYSFSEVATPQYFRFNINTQGYHSVSVKSSRRNSADYYDDVRTCVAMDIPALKDESLVWNVNDFRTKITFELQAIDIPGYFKSYATTWESINENLDKSDFSTSLKMSNPLKDETAAIKAEGGEESEQIRKILKLVTSRMNWDGKYTIWGKNPRQKLKDGAGSSADINFVLNSALRDAGFSTTPVLLNPRSYGRLPYGHPSMDNIRTFILKVDLSDGSSLFIDGTSGDHDINLIRPQLMVDRARLYGVGGEAGWVDLTNLADNRQQIMVSCKIDENGLITGTMENKLINATGFSTKSRYRDAGSEDEYIEKLESENNMEISSYNISGLNGYTVAESMDFSMKTEKAGAHTYLRSTIVPFITKNMLTQQQRELPVEFPYPATYELTAFVLIPDGYEVEEIPQPIRMTGCEKGVNYIYSASVSGNNIVIQLRYTLDRVVFASKEYPDLHTFMGMMSEKHNSRIILKKTI